MTKSLAQRLGMAALGVALLLAIRKIGEVHFDDFRTEYGWSPNVFGPREGSFFYLYAVLGSFAVVLLSFAGGGTLYRFFSRSSLSRVAPARIVIFLAVGAFLAGVFFRFVVFLEAPMTDDENAYAFAARILATGRLTLPGYPESLRPFLSNQFLVMEDRVFTQYYPGFPLVLALPLALGIEWIVNPLAAALGIVGTYLLGREITGDKWTGLLAAALLFVSPTYLLTAGTLFSNPVAAAWGVWGLYLIWRARQGGGWHLSLLGATCLGMLLMTRPLSGAACGAAGAWMLLSSGTPLRQRLASLAPAAIAGLIFCGGLLACHALTTGDPLVSGYAYFEKHVALSISSFKTDQFTSGRWLLLLGFPLLRFNAWLLGWPISLLLLPFVPKGPVRTFGLLVVLGIWFAHLPWTATGVNLTGAVHYFEAVPMLAILSAAGAMALLRREDSARSAFAFNVVVFSVAASIAVFFPWATGNLNRLARYNIAPYIAAQKAVQPPAVIFGTNTCNLFDMDRGRAETWTYFRKNNSVDLDDDVLWLNDRGPENAVAMRLFPGRRYYRLVSESTASGQTRMRVVEIAEPSVKQGSNEGGTPPASVPADRAESTADAGPAGDSPR